MIWIAAVSAVCGLGRGSRFGVQDVVASTSGGQSLEPVDMQNTATPTNWPKTELRGVATKG